MGIAGITYLSVWLGGEWNMEKVKILLIKPNELPKEMVIPNTLRAKQKLVGGLIEVCYMPDDSEVCLVCNEEGRINNLPINRVIGRSVIHGDFFVVGDDYEVGDFKSLTSKQIKKYEEYFGEESIEKTNSRITARKLAEELFRRSIK